MKSENDNQAILLPSDKENLRRLMLERFGLELRAGQEPLAQARLEKLLRTRGSPSYEDFRFRLAKDTSGELLGALADALTTNHTSLFREEAHFDFVRKWVREQGYGPKPIRIWSAGCATGEEAYSLACCAVDELGWDRARQIVKIQASDLSCAALAIAAEGIYPESRFLGLSLDWRRKFLLRGPDRLYRFKPELRALIQFHHLNLISSSPAREKFGVVFCRNVMIYFNSEVRQRVVQMLTSTLEPEGFLITGHCEGLAGVNHALRHIGPAIHQKQSDGLRATS